MHSLIILTLCASAVCDAIAAHVPGASLVKFVPELLSITITALVFFEGVRKGFRFMAPKYWLAFGLAAFIIVCGIFTNSVGAGPIVAGLRAYLRAIPLFVVPAVFHFSDKQLLKQVKMVLAIALLQIPLAGYQRYLVFSAGKFSGDTVSGTATDSGILSVTLICIALVTLGFFLRKRLSFASFVVLFLAVLFPTTINETKATVLLLPIGLITTVIAGSPPGTRVKVFAIAMTLLVTFGAILIPIYNYMERFSPYKKVNNLVSFFTNQEELQRYMAVKGGATVGTQTQVRRGDAIRVPLDYLSKDPVRAAFGLGLGNASHSNLGESFTGTYYDIFRVFAFLSISVFLLEIGILGTLIAFVLYAFLFFDAIAVARTDEGITGAIAVGWVGVIAVISAATFYSAIHVYPFLSYPYWYFAGVVAARHTQLALTSQRPRTIGGLRRAAF